jgi:tetratricopeptide (TPR) repeat protein
MGKDSATRELSSEEAGQALMVDELESAPAVVQEYSRDLAEEITSALTDSELFASYNVPEKAVVPLEKVLAKAPNDVRVRQRLAGLYARLGRLADAAACCQVLAEVHSVAGNIDQAKQLRDIAARYEQQAGGAAPSTAVNPVEAPLPPPPIEVATVEEPIPFQASSIANLEKQETAPHAAAAEFDLAASAPVQEIAGQTVPAASEAAPAETDHADWEDMLTVEAPAASVQEVTAQDSPDEIAEEARFYVDQGMLAEAKSAIARLESNAPNHPALAELREKAAAVEAPTKTASTRVETAPAKHATEVAPELAAKPEIAARSPEPVPQQKREQDEEEVLADLLADPTPVEVPKTAARPAPSPAPAQPKVAVAAASVAPRAILDDPLAGMLSDLEDALGDLAPAASTKPAAAVAKAVPPLRAPEPQPIAVSAGPRAGVQAAPASMNDEASSMLSDLLHEFKEEVEEPVAEADDPETHYNLGVAFREMGLLDEAIGELQKVCRSLDNGHSFSQPIQAYTWLAQCLVDKGAPQAAIRWYERALGVKGINEDSRLAVYYDLANAFESAGNKKAALDNFMQVYGANIDYRDVADRIRSLSK